MSRSVSAHSDYGGTASAAHGEGMTEVAGNVALLPTHTVTLGQKGKQTQTWREFWRWAYDEAA